MKTTGDNQINTRVYWNYIYTTPAREIEYWADTSRWEAIYNEVKDGDRFIEFGCGVGIPGRMIEKSRKGCEVWGTDISDEIIKKNTAEGRKVIYKQGYVGYQDFLPSDYFDVVFAGELLEHIDEPEVLFTEAHRILKKGGKLVVSTPREDSISSPEHLWEFTEDDVREYYLNAKFKDVRFIKLTDMDYMKIIFSVGVKA